MCFAILSLLTVAVGVVYLRGKLTENIVIDVASIWGVLGYPMTGVLSKALEVQLFGSMPIVGSGVVLNGLLLGVVGEMVKRLPKRSIAYQMPIMVWSIAVAMLVFAALELELYVLDSGLRTFLLSILSVPVPYDSDWNMRDPYVAILEKWLMIGLLGEGARHLWSRFKRRTQDKSTQYGQQAGASERRDQCA
jgi:hypothetical protein